MQFITLFISIIALAISIFTFYWTSLRKSRELTLVWLGSHSLTNMEFVFANGSNFDIFVTRVICSFSGSDKSAWMLPKQTCHFINSSSALIPGGSTVTCKISIIEAFDVDDLTQGSKNTNIRMPGSTLVDFDAALRVVWIEPSGREYESKCVFGRFSLDENAKLCASSEIKRKFQLYKSSTEIIQGKRPAIP